MADLKHRYKKRKYNCNLTFFTTICLHNYIYEGWNFNSGNYLFTTDTK